MTQIQHCDQMCVSRLNQNVMDWEQLQTVTSLCHQVSR